MSTRASSATEPATTPVSAVSGSLTIGVAAHGNVATTLDCLRGIFSSVSGDFDLILVDDASPDDIGEVFSQARDFHARTRVFRFSENREYSHSVNCILSHAKSEFVLFVSNDIYITPSYVRALLEAMADPGIGIARGVSNFVDGFVDSTLHNVAVDTPVATYPDVVALAEQVYAGNRPRTAHDLFLTGDAFMVRAKVIDVIGTYDTSYVGYLSDSDFGIRAAHAGFRRVVCGRAFAWHARDANISYLPEAEQAGKIARRRARIDAAWRVFREKWALHAMPEAWQGDLLRDIPFAALDALPFDAGRDVSPRGDYMPSLVA